MTNSHAIAHPSQPNYLDLFSGSNQGVTTDSCPHTFSSANLGHELIAAGFSFGSYSENLPAAGSSVCTATGGYARKHNPWVNFSNIPKSTNMPLVSFPGDFSQLPSLSFVIPNLCHDMHSCAPATGDAWLKSHLDAYVQWAKTNNSLLVLTFDENNDTTGNQITTIFVGPMVKTGRYSENITHYTLLRTLEDMYGLPYAGQSANVSPITDIWAGAAASSPTRTMTPGRPTPTNSVGASPTNSVGASATRTPTSAGSSTTSFQNGSLPNTSYAGMIDSMLRQGSATTNYGSATTLGVDGDDGNGVDKSVLVKWDISNIPAGKTVSSVSLTFQVVNASGDSYQVYEVKRNWNESQTTWNIFSSGNNWQTAGALGANDRGSSILGTAGPAPAGAYTITLNAAGIALIQNWVNNPAANFGLIIASPTSADGLDFSSSEAATASDRPKLTVVYH